MDGKKIFVATLLIGLVLTGFSVGSAYANANPMQKMLNGWKHGGCGDMGNNTNETNIWNWMHHYGMYYNLTVKTNQKFKGINGIVYTGIDMSSSKYTIMIGTSSTNINNVNKNVFAVILGYSGKIAYQYMFYTADKIYINSTESEFNSGIIVSDINGQNATGKVTVTVYPMDNPSIHIMLYGESAISNILNSNGVSNIVVGNYAMNLKMPDKDMLITLNKEPYIKSLLIEPEFSDYANIKNTITNSSGVVTLNTIKSGTLTNTPHIIFTSYKAVLNDKLGKFMKPHVMKKYFGEVNMILHKHGAYYIGNFSNGSSMQIKSVEKNKMILQVSSTKLHTGGYIFLKVNKNVWNEKFAMKFKVIMDNKTQFKEMTYSQIMNDTNISAYNITSYNSTTYLITLYVSHFSTHEIAFEKESNNSIWNIIPVPEKWKKPVLIMTFIVIVLIIALLIIRSNKRKGKGRIGNYYYKEIEI